MLVIVCMLVECSASRETKDDDVSLSRRGWNKLLYKCVTLGDLLSYALIAFKVHFFGIESNLFSYT
jgi:hypothetical protein